VTARAALLVLGATGAIGRGVVRAALDAGRPVIAVSSDRDGLRDMQGTHAHADLLPLVATLDTERRAAALAAKLRKLDRPIDGVVAALCTERERGRLLDVPAEALSDAINQNVVAHLAAARHLLPLLAEGGRAGGYILIDGPGGERPWAGYGHRSVGAAALHMLARVLHDEARGLGVRLQLLALQWPVRTEANAVHACAQWPSANGIGRRVLELLDRSDRAPTQAVISCTGPCPEDDGPFGAPQTSDSETDLLTSRCLQDARTLLGSLSTSTAPSPSKEDTHDRPNRR
jgi:NAD(P)-dependent dehydrogenase (short-subunit alcohol dehydrogenase family)